MRDTPIGTAIARARNKKRWTQRELAERLGVDRTSVANWETGGMWPAARNIPAIEDALGVDLSMFERKAS